MQAGEDVELFFTEVLLFKRHSDFDGTAAIRGRVAVVGRPDAEVNFRGFHLDFDVFVAQPEAQHAVGLSPGFAEHFAVGVVQVFVPALLVLQGEPAKLVAGHVEFLRGGLPGVPVGAVLRGLVEWVVE